jgi:hypothetical protein
MRVNSEDAHETTADRRTPSATFPPQKPLETPPKATLGPPDFAAVSISGEPLVKRS